MIASILSLDRRAIKTLDIQDEYSIHRVVYDLFPTQERSFLYYRYPRSTSPGSMKILILSQKSPDHPRVGSLELKTVDPSFLEWSWYAFKVRINPIVRSGGKEIAITSYDAVLEWFLDKQAQWGFSANPESLELQDFGVVRFQRGNHTVTLNECTVVGVLRVTDRFLFVKSFSEGIGRAKAFGFGLLQLQPIS